MSDPSASRATILWPGCYSGNAIHHNNGTCYFAVILCLTNQLWLIKYWWSLSTSTWSLLFWDPIIFIAIREPSSLILSLIYHQLHLQRMATTVIIDSGAFLTSKSHITLVKKLPTMEWSHLVGFPTSGSVCTLVCLLFGAFPLLIMKELAFLLSWCGPSLYSSFQSYSNSIVSRCPW